MSRELEQFLRRRRSRRM